MVNASSIASAFFMFFILFSSLFFNFKAMSNGALPLDECDDNTGHSSCQQFFEKKYEKILKYSLDIHLYSEYSSFKCIFIGFCMFRGRV